MKVVDRDLKILSIKNFFNPTLDEKKQIQEVVNLNYERQYRPSFRTTGPYNLPMLDGNLELLDQLYQKFVDACSDIFGEIYISLENTNTCYAYRGNKIDMGERFDNWWHNHFYTATINSVYYLDVFGDGITFRDGGKELDYLPENGEMLIFPPDLVHAPQPNRTLNYRYSINMELKANHHPPELFDRIF